MSKVWMITVVPGWAAIFFLCFLVTYMPVRKGDFNIRQCSSLESTCALKSVITGFASLVFKVWRIQHTILFTEAVVDLMCSLKVRVSYVIASMSFTCTLLSYIDSFFVLYLNSSFNFWIFFPSQRSWNFFNCLGVIMAFWNIWLDSAFSLCLL